jgi:hypothetical protein
MIQLSFYMHAQNCTFIVGFNEWRVEQNALLSDDAKCLMFKLWSAERHFWTPELLARVFKIRVQRALAIVKIKDEEFVNVRLLFSKFNNDRK